MNMFARREELTPRDAFRRVEKLLRAGFKVQKFTENDWMFQRPSEEACLLTMWGFEAPDYERHVMDGPVDGLIWDLAWCARRRNLSEGALVLANGAAGRGRVELSKGDFLNPSEIFFYDRLTTPLEFNNDEAKEFLEACADAVARIDRALKQG